MSGMDLNNPSPTSKLLKINLIYEATTVPVNTTIAPTDYQSQLMAEIIGFQWFFAVKSLQPTVRYSQFDDRTLQKESSATGAVKTLRNQNKKKKASEPDDATNSLPALHQCPVKTNCKVAL